MPDGWLAAAFALVRAAGGLCIADEVQVGYGRPGRHFWAFEQQRVVPDLVTIAKPAGNGHPLGAVICTRALADALDAREDLFSSPGGGPVSCAIGLAVLDALEREGLQENARVVGDHLTARLAPLADRFEPVERAARHGPLPRAGPLVERRRRSPLRAPAGARRARPAHRARRWTC